MTHRPYIPAPGVSWPRLRRGERRPIAHHVRVAVYMRDGRICRFCGDTLGPFHLDHIQPWTAYGEDDPRNLRVLCEPCNLSRSTRATVEDDRIVMPITTGCASCQPWAHEPGSGELALCVLCDAVEYAHPDLRCWIDSCGCGNA